MARDEAAALADDTAIMQIAQNRAGAIEERARRDVDRMRSEADAYAYDTLTRLKDELEHTLAVVTNGVGKLEADRAARAGLNNATEPQPEANSAEPAPASS
jgi:hypothetical protein